MEGILAGLVNLGLGGTMTAALVWFLHHLVTKTLPEITLACREEIRAERDLRLREHKALLGLIRRLAERAQREHEAILARIDLGLKGLGRDPDESRTAGGRSTERPPSAEPGHTRPQGPDE